MARIDGSGIITISNGNANTNNLQVWASGSGLINAAGLMVKDARASVKGSGNIQLFATQTLMQVSQCSGSILYKGSPAVTTTFPVPVL